MLGSYLLTYHAESRGGEPRVAHRVAGWQLGSASVADRQVSTLNRRESRNPKPQTQTPNFTSNPKPRNPQPQPRFGWLGGEGVGLEHQEGLPS